jgi:hypothetical protein
MAGGKGLPAILPTGRKAGAEASGFQAGSRPDRTRSGRPSRVRPRSSDRRFILLGGGSHTRRPSLQPGCHAGTSNHRALEKPSSAEGCHHFRWIIRHHKPPAGPPAFIVSPQQHVTCRTSAGKHSRAHPSLSRARLRPSALVRYSGAHPQIENADIVLWYTLNRTTGHWYTCVCSRWQNPLFPPLSKGEREARGDLSQQIVCTILVWCDLGLHHIVQAEDWPVLPVWHAFELRLFDFFARNPAWTCPNRGTWQIGRSTCLPSCFLICTCMERTQTFHTATGTSLCERSARCSSNCGSTGRDRDNGRSG